MNSNILVLKSTGESELFDPTKLEESLEKAGASTDTVNKIVDHISSELVDGISTSEIYKHAFYLLKKIERPVASRYSLRRAVMELGPTGFGFEKFVAEIFKAMGFTTETDKVVNGFCTEHEMDVIAYNENKLIMCEAKFHNDQIIKSDVKVALYIKARFEDLQKNKFFYGKERSLDEGWLITNTKFTSAAIKYGKCQNLKMVGWNYPYKGNLQDMINDTGVHPITCLSSLTGAEKKILISKDIVLCKTIRDNKDVLKSIGMSELKQKKVLAEISLL